MRSFFTLMAISAISLSLSWCAFGEAQNSSSPAFSAPAFSAPASHEPASRAPGSYEQESNAKESAAQEPVVVATVNGDPITQSQIDFDMKKFTGELKLSASQLSVAKKSILERLIDQKVTMDYLKTHKLAAGESEIRLKVDELKNELELVGKTLDDYLKASGQTQPELEFQFALDISWKRYLEPKLTDEFLEGYFKQHRRDFDGTELRVAHLLIKVPADAKPEKRETALNEAKALKRKLDASEDWDEIVKQHSQAPTKDDGGKIGWIRIDGPMPRPFTQAAFVLQKNQVSDPVTTHFGVHLIKCLEVKQGKIGWRDTRESVENAAQGALFQTISRQHRANVKIEYAKAD